MAEVATGRAPQRGQHAQQRQHLHQPAGRSAAAQVARHRPRQGRPAACVSTPRTSPPSSRRILKGKQLPAFLVALSEQPRPGARGDEPRGAGAQPERGPHQVHRHHAAAARAHRGRPARSCPCRSSSTRRCACTRCRFERLDITIVRDYADVPPVLVDRHKLLQILINLLSNARHALVDSDKQDKRLAIRIRRSGDGRFLLIDVEDNGRGNRARSICRACSLRASPRRSQATALACTSALWPPPR